MWYSRRRGCMIMSYKISEPKKTCGKFRKLFDLNYWRFEWIMGRKEKLLSGTKVNLFFPRAEPPTTEKCFGDFANKTMEKRKSFRMTQMSGTKAIQTVPSKWKSTAIHSTCITWVWAEWQVCNIPRLNLHLQSSALMCRSLLPRQLIAASHAVWSNSVSYI